MTFFLPTRFLDERTLPFLVVQNLEARLPNVRLEARRPTDRPANR